MSDQCSQPGPQDGPPPPRWNPIWATGSQSNGALPGAAAGHDVAIRAVAMAADGRFAVTADEAGDVRLRDAATGRQIGRPMRDEGGAGQVTVTVIDDRPRVITGSGPEGTVRVWDPATGRQAGPASGFPARITALAAASDSLLAGFGCDVAVLSPR
ncbi:WD40 repeat domain-containing protein [Planobispora longispora]|nr:hypothetical protein [Planobispora longispora]